MLQTILVAHPHASPLSPVRMLALAWHRPSKRDRENPSPKKHESENPSPSLSPRLQAFYDEESEARRRVVKQ